MSRAFVKEQDGVEDSSLPEIPLSDHLNYITPRGLAQLRQRLADVQARHEAAERSADTLSKQNDLVALERELRYLRARVGGAIEVDLTQQPHDRVAFGATVVVDSIEGEHRYRIVGEDEADGEHGLVSYVSPLAHALVGSRIGDEVIWKRPAGDLTIEVIAIRYSTDD